MFQTDSRAFTHHSLKTCHVLSTFSQTYTLSFWQLEPKTSKLSFQPNSSWSGISFFWVLGSGFNHQQFETMWWGSGGGDRCVSGGQDWGLGGGGSGVGGEGALILPHPQVILFASGNHWLAPFTSADQEQKYHSVKNGLRAPVVKPASSTSRVQDPWRHPSVFPKSQPCSHYERA